MSLPDIELGGEEGEHHQGAPAHTVSHQTHRPKLQVLEKYSACTKSHNEQQCFWSVIFLTGPIRILHKSKTYPDPGSGSWEEREKLISFSSFHVLDDSKKRSKNFELIFAMNHLKKWSASVSFLTDPGKITDPCGSRSRIRNTGLST